LVPGANKGFTIKATEITEKNGLAFLREFCDLSAIQIRPMTRTLELIGSTGK